MYRKYNLLTGSTGKRRFVSSVSEITLSFVFPAYLKIWKLQTLLENKVKLRTLKSKIFCIFVLKSRK